MSERLSAGPRPMTRGQAIRFLQRVLRVVDPKNEKNAGAEKCWMTTAWSAGRNKKAGQEIDGCQYSVGIYDKSDELIPFAMWADHGFERALINWLDAAFGYYSAPHKVECLTAAIKKLVARDAAIREPSPDSSFDAHPEAAAAALGIQDGPRTKGTDDDQA